MIIGEFNDSFPPLMDGVGNVVNNYRKELTALGDTVYVVTGGYADAAAYDEKMGWGDRVFRMPGKVVERLKPYGILKTPHELRKRLMDIPFDLIHVHCPFYSGRLGMEIAKAKHIPLVGTFHTQFRDDINGYVHDFKPLTEMVVRFEMKVYQACDAVWTPSDATRRVLLSSYYCHRPVTVMENACDMVIPTPQELEAMRSRAFSYAHVTDEAPIFLYIGQHKDCKNIPLILDSLDLLHQQGVSFQMLFVGVGPQMEAYQKYVQEHDLASCVHFLGRISDRSLVASLYAISTLFLFPSLYDTSCLVMREAACFQVPVVFIRGACTSEGIVDGENGYLAENTPESFGGAIKRAILNPEEHDRVGKQAQKSLYRSWTEVGGIVRSAYQQIIQEHQR
ncbi:MAG: glycosyltransferase [Sphaerochaeta sp.]|nr:glycosyltransferase [Sphaerochaeta sp.]MCH3919280.1 glycosyltransferase [Sphaerochaeta sp.]MCI2097861.1 glycosyltransferase [Sphaerochaeta sp.]MCI2105045.1 glycosyltransferase [Sphaerochaeta sp.]MCI2128050.1 glycosyltransferase [Sphaerochaeta sp.]